MYYINACSTISYQDSFQNEGWASNLKELTADSALVSPNFKAFISGGDLRRMSQIIRMGISCGKDCMAQTMVYNPDAIIVGTGLGCLVDTEKFLKNSVTIEGLIPPTAFIQSTHNTIAGQISLATKNHNYNMTHTQNSLSFEHALLDGMLCLDEGHTDILVGAADESIGLMDEILEQLGRKQVVQKMTRGASFFMLSGSESNSSKAKIVDSCTSGLGDELFPEMVKSFLANNNLVIDSIDLVLFSSNGTHDISEAQEHFGATPVFSYEKYCGYYLTNSAFGMHLAAEILNQNDVGFLNVENPIRRILLCNTFNRNIGLTIIESLEA